MLTQEEAERLIAKLKHIIENNLIIPSPGNREEINVKAINGKDSFVIDIYRGKYNIKKCSYQARYNNKHILMRLDLCGRHTNPDGEVIGAPHLHIYREGYDDKWAFEFDLTHRDLVNNCIAFMREFNIIELPNIECQEGIL